MKFIKSTSCLNGLTNDKCVQIISDKAIIYIPVNDLVDVQAEIERLEQEKSKLISEIERIDNKLSNVGFVSKAPQQVVEAEKTKRVGYVDKLNAVNASIEKYKNS